MKPWLWSRFYNVSLSNIIEFGSNLETCDRILNDEFFNVSEQSLYVIGTVDEVKNRSDSLS